MKNNQSGFIALISAIIISVLLLTLTVGVGMRGISGRLNILDSESKERSSALAEACADTAILNLSQASSQPANPISIGPATDDKCSIISTSNNTIKTQAVINRAYTNLTVGIDSNYNIVSWDETPN